MFRLYFVTDRSRTAGRPLVEVVEAALAGGVDAVQLREKDLPARDLLDLARRLRTVCASYGARLLINDRVDIALTVGADGVHLPANSFTPADARRLLGPGRLIGASAHSVDEARAASGADFVVCGPVFDTPSKRQYGAPLGIDGLATVIGAASCPVLAIGGVTAERVVDVCRRGAHGVAVVAALSEARDPMAAARALRAALS
jgi:thiamine-phosphate pyrophosphorylase